MWTVHIGRTAISLLKSSLSDVRYVSKATSPNDRYRLTLWRGFVVTYCVIQCSASHLTVIVTADDQPNINFKFRACGIIQWLLNAPSFSQTSNLIPLVWMYRRYNITYYLSCYPLLLVSCFGMYSVQGGFMRSVCDVERGHIALYAWINWRMDNSTLITFDIREFHEGSSKCFCFHLDWTIVTTTFIRA